MSRYAELPKGLSSGILLASIRNFFICSAFFFPHPPYTLVGNYEYIPILVFFSLTVFYARDNRQILPICNTDLPRVPSNERSSKKISEFLLTLSTVLLVGWRNRDKIDFSFQSDYMVVHNSISSPINFRYFKPPLVEISCYTLLHEH